MACARTKNEMTKFAVVIQMWMWILDPNESPTHVTSAMKWVLFIIILYFFSVNKAGHFWECLLKRCIVAPNKRGGEGGEVIVPKPAGTASTLRPVATKEC